MKTHELPHTKTKGAEQRVASVVSELEDGPGLGARAPRAPRAGTCTRAAVEPETLAEAGRDGLPLVCGLADGAVVEVEFEELLLRDLRVHVRRPQSKKKEQKGTAQ